MNISTLFYTKHNIQPSLKLPASFYTSGPHKDKDKCWTDCDNFTMCTEGFLARSRLQAFHWQPACRALREETSMISPQSCKSEQGLPAGCEIKSILPVLCSLFLNTSAWTVLLTFCSCFNLVAVVNFLPSQSHLLHSLHTFSLEKAQRKGNWSIPQTKRVMNILMFCSLSVLLNYQIFRNKSSFASFTPKLQQLPQVHPVYMVSQAYVALHRQIKQVDFPTQRPHNLRPRPCTYLCTRVITLERAISLLTTELERRVMLLTGKSIGTD